MALFTIRGGLKLAVDWFLSKANFDIHNLHDLKHQKQKHWNIQKASNTVQIFVCVTKSLSVIYDERGCHSRKIHFIVSLRSQSSRNQWSRFCFLCSNLDVRNCSGSNKYNLEEDSLPKSKEVTFWQLWKLEKDPRQSQGKDELDSW